MTTPFNSRTVTRTDTRRSFLNSHPIRNESANRPPHNVPPLLDTNTNYFLNRNTATLLTEPTEALSIPNLVTNEAPQASYTLPENQVVIGRPPEQYGAWLGEVVPQLGTPAPVPGEVVPAAPVPAPNQPIDIEANIQVPGQAIPGCDVPNVPPAEVPYSNTFTHFYVREDVGSGVPESRSPGVPSSGGPGVPEFWRFRSSESLDSGVPPNLQHGMFWLAILLFGFWLAEFGMSRFTKFMEGYLQARQKMHNSPETPEEQKRFGRFSDWLLGTAAAILTPELAEKLISNIANRWTRAILKVSVPLLKLTDVVGLSAGVGGTGLIATKWLSKYFNTYLDKAVGQVTRPISASSDGRLVFLELVIKCLVGGFLAGSICRVICEAQENSRENVVMLVVQSGGLYFLFNDKVVCLQIAKALLDIPVIAMFLNSQLGRWAFILGNIRILGIVERTPYTVSFYFIFVYLFRVFMYASMATPNLF
nr:hypothetical protein [Halimeda borneensis]